MNKIKFLGNVFSENGIAIDKSKVEAILGMKKPEDASALERFFGMTTYVAKFIPNLTKLTEPLRKMDKSKEKLVWSQEQSQAYNEIKSILTKAPVLRYFDVNKDCKISVDASSTGVGAVLLQNGLPVAYASKSLTKTQRNWAQIEKELYAIVFGCERFEQFVMGRPFAVESDHKPLIPIMKKNVEAVPIRLQNMKMRLQRFDVIVDYKPGKELLIADTLSRANLELEENDNNNKLPVLEIKLLENMSANK